MQIAARSGGCDRHLHPRPAAAQELGQLGPVDAVHAVHAPRLPGRPAPHHGTAGTRLSGALALAPGFVATDLNNHTGTDTVEQGGARIARQVLLPEDGPTGVFLRESGGTYPW